MKINTTRFGEMEIEEEKIIDFPLGIPGFAELNKFVLIDYKGPIKWLHSVDDPDVAFIVTDPFVIFSDYVFKLGDEEERFLELKGPEDLVVLVILAVSDDTLTANLKAPIILNASRLRAAQFMLDDERYQFRVPLPALPAESGK